MSVAGESRCLELDNWTLVRSHCHESAALIYSVDCRPDADFQQNSRGKTVYLNPDNSGVMGGLHFHGLIDSRHIQGILAGCGCLELCGDFKSPGQLICDKLRGSVDGCQHLKSHVFCVRTDFGPTQKRVRHPSTTCPNFRFFAAFGRTSPSPQNLRNFLIRLAHVGDKYVAVAPSGGFDNCNMQQPMKPVNRKSLIGQDTVMNGRFSVYNRANFLVALDLI